MCQLFNDFTYVSSEDGRQLLGMVRSSFLNVGIAFTILKLLGKFPFENDKFAISDIVLLSTV